MRITVLNNFYVYAYLRCADSATAKAGTPYYIGKGSKKRILEKHTSAKIPENKNNIVILESNLTEIGALALERRYIKWYGRKNIGTGILNNLTDGGEGTSGYKHTSETKQKIANASAARKGLYHRTEEQKEFLSNLYKGKRLSEESIRKSAETRKGLKRPYISNRPRSDAEKLVLEKMTDAVKIIVEINDTIYSSIREAAKSIGMHEETVRARCRNNNFPTFKIMEKQYA